MRPNPSILYSIIHEHSETSPDAPAILAPGRKSLSYRDLLTHIEIIALQLNHLGFRRGDRVAVILPNGPEMATAYLSVSSACTCAPLNPAYREDEFTFSMRDLRAKALITCFGKDNPSYKAAVGLGMPILSLEANSQTAGLFTLSSDLPIDTHQSEPILSELDDTALVLHTSGTTSRPKIVPLSHLNVFYSVSNIAGTYALTSLDCCLNMMPLFHIHGLMGALAASLIAGASVICAPGFIPDRVIDWLAELGPTWYTAVPTIHQAILEQVHRQPEKVITPLRFIRSCSSSLPPQLARDLETTFGVPVLEAYGMTEATHQMASNPLPPQIRKFGSVGLPTGTTDISILDESGTILPKNSMGEICIRGENVMAGYENNPTANATSFTGGWLRTGDRGSIDNDGYLFIQGRLKELINRGGEKISPREIDEVLLANPAILQAVAFAVPHPSLGEDIGAAVVLRQGCTVSTQELRQFVATRLADFKVPRQIIFLKEIPKGPTGKIQRIGLAEKLKAELEASRFHESDFPLAPASPLEADIISIWQEVLHMEKVGIQDDFLALGGDSIQASIMLSNLNDRYGTQLAIEDFFSNPTIPTLAGAIERKINPDKYEMAATLRNILQRLDDEELI